MNIRQLEQFVAVAETESFSRGAQRSLVTQPALSNAIQKLENELGVSLFIRNKRKATLTSEGKRLLLSARKILQECDTVIKDLQNVSEKEALRIGVLDTIPVGQVSKLFETFKEQNLNVHMRIFEGDGNKIAESLEQGRLDLILTIHSDFHDLSERFMHAALYEEDYVVALPPNHRFIKEKSISIDALADEPFIARTHCESRAVFQRVLEDYQVLPDVTYRTNQDHRALEMVSKGMGLGIFPKSLCRTSIPYVDIADEGFHRRVGLYWREGQINPGGERFIHFAQSANWLT
ncbi:Transcriptional regulator, LysR family [Candidatus Terasakiella magnetica]|uniref:Transcriptional regulator, LysR family n=1 Tax=Candidatus Terasakiella magnetica TaxID=1867952 RepID=A0A1C3RGX9_9PROT|nr:LysR family transcriptional regulator [Candidatus Terasakiella magnetica]SCA56530.1 Transcriptional regulator, LysR family [Candidatus Terasakiella magnetica]